MSQYFDEGLRLALSGADYSNPYSAEDEAYHFEQFDLGYEAGITEEPSTRDMHGYHDALDAYGCREDV